MAKNASKSRRQYLDRTDKGGSQTRSPSSGGLIFHGHHVKEEPFMCRGVEPGFEFRAHHTISQSVQALKLFCAAYLGQSNLPGFGEYPERRRPFVVALGEFQSEPTAKAPSK